MHREIREVLRPTAEPEKRRRVGNPADREVDVGYILEMPAFQEGTPLVDLLGIELRDDHVQDASEIRSRLPLPGLQPFAAFPPLALDERAQGRDIAVLGVHRSIICLDPASGNDPGTAREAGGSEEPVFELCPDCVSDALAAILRTAAAIPVGYASTYGDVVAAAGSVARAVGRVMATNPLYPIVACHRVVGFGGRLSPPGASFRESLTSETGQGWEPHALNAMKPGATLPVMGQNRGFDWFRQAREDLLWTEDTVRAKRYAQACFAAQQVGEKAIKALALQRGNAEVRSHSILEIARALRLNGEIEEIAKRLDQYYISSRYPDSFPTGAPFDYFTREQAEEALRFADRMVRIVSGSFREEIESETRRDAGVGEDGKERGGAEDPLEE